MVRKLYFLINLILINLDKFLDLAKFFNLIKNIILFLLFLFLIILLFFLLEVLNNKLKI